MRIWTSLAAVLALAGAAAAAPPGEPDSASEARLLRFPAIHGDQIVFTYAGDLYTVPATGGTARRLTSDVGFEMFARFSPDGKQIAFTGQYDGNTEVYVMPAEGGTPRRLTYTATLHRDDVSDRMGPNNIVMGWTPDGKRVVFRSRMRSFNDFLGQLYTVSLDGGLPEQLPLPRGGFCSYSPDGKKLAYNRVFREFRTWKRYRGGMADDVWIYDFETKKIDDFTAGSRDVSDPDEPAGVHPQNIIPMWSGDKIYFLSDRDAHKRMNLYVQPVFAKTKTETKQLTTFTDFDVQVPVAGRQGHRLRERRLDLPPRPGHGEGRESADPHPGRLPRVAHRAGQRPEEPHGIRRFAGRQARPLRGPRRRVHRAGPERRDARPDQHLGRPRTQRRLVAGRQVDRLPLRRDRRGRDLRRPAGRLGAGPEADR